MIEKNNSLILPEQNKSGRNELTDYTNYPVKEDIYNTLKQAENLDPEDLSNDKKVNKNIETNIGNEKDFNEKKLFTDFDIPGSELDDELENIGSEDEENNYYSLGGDDHNDLDEVTSQ